MCLENNTCDLDVTRLIPVGEDGDVKSRNLAIFHLIAHSLIHDTYVKWLHTLREGKGKG